MSSLPTRGSRAAKPHQRKPYERPPPSPAPLARSKSSFFNTVKSIVTAPIAWLSGGDASSPSAANGAAGEGKPLKRRASKNRVDGGEGSRPKRMRTISPPRASASGYLDPPDHMLRHTISAATFARATGLKSVFSNGDTARPSIRDTPLHFNSLQRAKSPSRRTPSLGPWFPQPASTRNSLAPRPSQVHFDALPHLNIDAAIAAHDDSRMLSPSPSVGHGVAVGLGRERTPSRALPGREPSVSLSRVSVSRATGASIRASLSASNPFASLGKSSSVAPERKKSSLIWDDTLGVTKADTNEPKGTPAPAAKNTAERLLNALENMHTHTGDAQRPRRRPPPSVQVPTPGPSVPSKLKRMIQPYGEVKLSPKAKSKGTQGRPMSGLMKILMKNKKDSEAEEMEVEESSKPAEATKPIDAPKPAEKSEKVVEKPKEADKADKTGDVDMESQSNSAPATSPALKVIDNFRPVSQPPSRPGSSLRHSKSITKRAHAPSAGRNRFSANNEDEEEDEEAAERRNAELVAVANASVFKVPEGFKFGVSATPALPTPKPVEQTKPDSTMNVISPKPVPAKTTPNPILSFTPIAVPKSDDPPPKPVFFAGSEGTKTELPKVQNPFAGLGGGFGGKPEVKVPDVPKWGAPPAVPVAPTLAAKPSGEVSVFANVGVSAPAPTAKPASEAKPVFSFGKPAEPAPAPAPEKTNEPAKPLLGSSPFSFGKSNPLPTPASLPTPAPASNPFAGIGVDKSIAAAPAPAPTLFSFGASKPGTPTAPAAAPATPAPAPAFSFGKPAEATEAPKPVIEAPKPSPSPFSFAPVEKSATPPAAPLSLFGGSSSAVTTAPVPVAPPVSLAPAPFSFGAPATSTPAIATPAVATPTPQPAASPFTFGISSTTATAAPAAPEPKKSPFDFSASVASPAPVPAPAQVEAPKKSPFDFSSAPAPAPTTSKSPFDFSSAKPAENPATPFTFGTPNPPPAPATEKKSPFDFSAVPKPAPSPFAFGAPAPAPAPVPTPAAPATTNGFTFGPPAPARPATPPSGGDAAMEESPTREPAKIVTSGFGSGPGFGAQVPSSSFAFGSANGTNGGSTGPFGAPVNTSTTAQTNGFGSSVAPASPAPFAFGASNGTSSGFGSNGFNTNGNSTPAATPFAFGAGGGFGQPASATASPSNPFNQPAPSNPFGQPNPAPANGFQTPASPFPSATPLANTGFNTNNPGPINTFGSTPAATNGFPSSPAPVNQPSFSFGNNAPNTGTASPATFTFGLPASPATPTATSAPFVFGAGAAPPEQGSPAAGVQFNLGTADASPGGRKIKPLRRPRRN